MFSEKYFVILESKYSKVYHVDKSDECKGLV